MNDAVYQKLHVSQRQACKVLGQSRTTQCRELSPPSDEKVLIKDIVEIWLLSIEGVSNSTLYHEIITPDMGLMSPALAQCKNHHSTITCLS